MNTATIETIHALIDEALFAPETREIICVAQSWSRSDVAALTPENIDAIVCAAHAIERTPTETDDLQYATEPTLTHGTDATVSGRIPKPR